MYMSSKHIIDESHALSHSMDVLRISHDIYNVEVLKNPVLREHERIIYISAILHDMCDKKYMTETDGIIEICEFLEDKIDENEIDIIKKIISTMSYSTVKKNGFPEMGDYQNAYHIVREADLLSAYDFDRCMVYHMYKQNPDIEDAFHVANILFENRIFRHNEDRLFTTDYAKQQSIILHTSAIKQIYSWKTLLKSPKFI